MTHEVLSRVINAKNPYASKDGVKKLMWQLEVLPGLDVMHFDVYIYIYSCV